MNREARRPDADLLLARVREEERRRKRGKLTVFFGAAPGVGKTYAMLARALARHAQGVDVVVALVETHGLPHFSPSALSLWSGPNNQLCCANPVPVWRRSKLA